MLVYDFLILATENSAIIDVFNCDDNTEINNITISDAIDRFGEWYIHSFDGYIYDNKLCINISEKW